MFEELDSTEAKHEKCTYDINAVSPNHRLSKTRSACHFPYPLRPCEHRDMEVTDIGELDSTKAKTREIYLRHQGGVSKP